MPPVEVLCTDQGNNTFDHLMNKAPRSGEPDSSIFQYLGDISNIIQIDSNGRKEDEFFNPKSDDVNGGFGNSWDEEEGNVANFYGGWWACYLSPSKKKERPVQLVANIGRKKSLAPDANGASGIIPSSNEGEDKDITNFNANWQMMYSSQSSKNPTRPKAALSFPLII